MKIFSQDLIMAIAESQRSTDNYVRFAVYGYYLNENDEERTTGVTVEITADGYTQHDNYIDVPLGTVVAYKVTKEDYTPEGWYYVTVTGPVTKRVRLTNLPTWTFTVTPTPADSTVVMAGGNKTSNTGTIQVPEGTLVTYTIAHAMLQSYSNSRMIPINPQTETSPITITRTLEALLEIDSISPDGDDVSVSWNTGVGDPQTTRSVLVPCTTSQVVLTVSKPGYNSVIRNFPQEPGYVLNANTGAIVLTPKTCHCTITCNNPTAEMEAWKEDENGDEIPGTRTQPNQGSITIDGIVGDDIHWSASQQYYTTKTGHHVITAEDADNGTYTDTVTMVINNYPVTISANPAATFLKIFRGSTELERGNGEITVGVDAGTYITYTAEIGGITKSGNATITGPYSYQFVIDPMEDASVTVKSLSETVSLPYGKYKFIIVGGGAGGSVPSSGAGYGARYRAAGPGAGGGGSGYAVIEEIMVSSWDGETVEAPGGQQAVLNIGAGGLSNSAGGDTTVNIGGVLHTAEGGKNGDTTQTGGSGGSGGGAGGYAEIHPNASTYLGTDGGNGAYGGGNGQQVRRMGAGNQWNTCLGGVGFYETTKSYENNYGAAITAVANGTPGGGGRGLITQSAFLTNVENFVALSDVQDLYNYMGGGGGGGPTGVPSSAVAIYGGSGGGGGGWQPGTAGTTGAPGAGGTGGAGVVLYMRVAWS